LRASNGGGPGGAVCATGLKLRDVLGNISVLAENQTHTQVANPSRIDAGRGAQLIIEALAELFPQAFVAERWLPHRPLKIGIHLDLIARGILKAEETRPVLGRYVGRLQYQRALAAGGARYDLNGNEVGEVSPENIEQARQAVARLEAKAIARSEEARANFKASQAKRRSAEAPKEQSQPRRLGLADLKRAAVARRAAS
jgi:sRNA-binding protein